MQVTSSCQGWRRWKRPPFAAVMMFALAGFGGLAQAVEFDEKVRAPMMKSAADFNTQAKSLATKYREILAAPTPVQLITNASLTRQQFDLSWQLERSINERLPLGNLETMGFVSLGNGGYSVDTRKHPEWRVLGDDIASIFNSNLRDGVYGELLHRGFRSEDVTTLQEYIVTHDVKQATRMATVPIARGFQRVVQKFDKAGRPVPDALVISYWYQSTRAYSEANRAWSEGLLKTLDDQRVRVLLSYLTEVDASRILIPESVSEGITGTLASMRSPNFEERLKSTDGGAP